MSLFDSESVPLEKKSVLELFGDTDIAVAPQVDIAPAIVTPPRNRWLHAMRNVKQTDAEILVDDVPEKITISKATSPQFNVNISAIEEDEPKLWITPIVSNVNLDVPVAPPPPVVEIEANPNHLILVVHGVNGSEDALDRNLTQMRASFAQVRDRWFPDSKENVHIEMINWKSAVIELQSSIFEKITPRHVAFESRMFINYSISDVAFYLTPSHQTMIQNVVSEMLNNRVKNFKKVSLVGYSLGSLIIHDLLNSAVSPLHFDVSHVFFWGSPLAAYLSVKDLEYQSGKFVLPNRFPIFNIYHPHDPVAFRIEPLFYYLDSELADSEIVLNWETNKKIHISKTSLWNTIIGSSKISASPLIPHRRLDFVIQESLAENLNHQYSMLHAHYSYWGSRDVAFFMLKKLFPNS